MLLIDLEYQCEDNEDYRQQVMQYDAYVLAVCKHRESFIHQKPIKHPRYLSVNLPTPPPLKLHQTISVQCIRLQYRDIAKKRFKSTAIALKRSTISGDYLTNGNSPHRRRLKWKLGSSIDLILIFLRCIVINN